MKILPLGSIVSIDGTQALTLGYTFLPCEDKQQIAYLVVPYPVGFTKADGLRAVPAKGVEVIEQGYHTPLSDTLCTYIESIGGLAEKCTTEELKKALSCAMEEIRKGDLMHE